MGDNETELRWLVLVYQFPQVPGSLRVKIWRRLQGIGAVAIKNSMYALPLNEQAREDFQWLLTELTSAGAEGAILESRFVDGLGDDQVRGLFNSARDDDYKVLVEEVRAFIADQNPSTDSGEETIRDAHRLLSRSRRRFSEIKSIDYFEASNQQNAAAALRLLEEHMGRESDGSKTEGETMTPINLDDLKKRVWVTRRDVHVDRIASAWLIRRWIDPDAVFKFVASKGYSAGPRELRFDMFDAEFGHQGDMCTFEVLSQLVRPDDTALRGIAEIIHDIDLKDFKYGRAETQGIALLLAGIVAGNDDDDRRINRGSTMFDDLYCSIS